MVFSKALARIFNCGRVFAVQVLLLSLSAVAVAGVGVAAPLGKTDEGMFLLKPGVDIPARDLRRFQSGRKNIKFFGALAVSRIGKHTWHATTGANSARVAADIAKQSCELKAGPESLCEVVALKVPTHPGVSFDQALDISGVSQTCMAFWRHLRDPSRRSTWRQQSVCVALHLDEAGRHDLQGSRGAGNTLYVAQNDYYGTIFVFGADADLTRRLALSACSKMQEDIRTKLDELGSMHPKRWTSNLSNAEVEARVGAAYNRSNAQFGRCRIVASEVLP